MTAYRVLDDHKELDNIGSRTHDEIDVHIDTSAFLIVSGVSSHVPALGRVLTAGTNIQFTDGGPGGSFTVSVSGSISSNPGGNDTHVQFNDGGAFGGESTFTYNKSTNTMRVTNMSGSLTRLTDGSPYLIGGANISVVTNPNGSITINSAGGGGGGGGGTLISWLEEPVGDIDGVNMVYTLTNSPLPANGLQLYVNGILQRGDGNDFFLSNDTFVMNYAPQSGSTVLATYPYATTIPNTMWMDFPTGDVDGINSVFSLSYSPNPTTALMFFVNGILQRQGASADYTVAGPTVSFNYVPQSGSNLIATYPY